MGKGREKAKIKEDKAEELQTRIDAAKERRNENKKFTEDILDGVAEATSVTSNVNAAQQEINDMMHKMNLIEDDIKGAAVDKTI